MAVDLRAPPGPTTLTRPTGTTRSTDPPGRADSAVVTGTRGMTDRWPCPHGMDARAPARRSWTYNFLYFSTPPTALGARRVSLTFGTSIKDCQKTSAHWGARRSASLVRFRRRTSGATRGVGGDGSLAVHLAYDEVGAREIEVVLIVEIHPVVLQPDAAYFL